MTYINSIGLEFLKTRFIKNLTQYSFYQQKPFKSKASSSSSSNGMDVLKIINNSKSSISTQQNPHLYKLGGKFWFLTLIKVLAFFH